MECLSALIETANPSIAVRVKTEILRQPLAPGEWETYAPMIAREKTLQTVLSWQNSGGYFSERLHTPPSNSKVWSHEGCVRYLLEKGFAADYEPLGRSLSVMLESGWGRECEGSAAAAAFGHGIIRASLFAQAGLCDYDFISEWIERAVQSFRYIADAVGYEDVAALNRGKYAFIGEKRLPTVYSMRMLAFTDGWRTPENMDMMEVAFRKLYEWLPIPPTYIKAKSRLIAPLGTICRPFNRDLTEQDGYPWFQFYEMAARMGVLGAAPFAAHLDRLMERIAASGGWFAEDYGKAGYIGWSGYSGIALEDGWKIHKNRINDFTFRCHLIHALAKNALPAGKSRARLE